MKVLVIAESPDIVEPVSLTFSVSWLDAEVVSAPDGATGIYSADMESPTLVLLDIDLPDMDGFIVCKEIRRFSAVPIIILTRRNGKADIVRGLDLGADDYIIQPFRPLEFMVRVKALLRRTQPIPSAVGNGLFEHGHLRVDFCSNRVALGERPVKLTDTEYRLLYHLIRNAGRAVPHRTLLGLVWGQEFTEEAHYLKGHIKKLREKLEDDSSEPQYIVTERNVGYKFAGMVA